MATVEDILDQVDGLRRDAADRVAKRFATVNALASATTEQLTEISGIGKVMADRIHAVAAGAKGGQAAAASPSTPGSTAGGDAASATPAGHDRGLVGKVVETATGTAKGVVDKAAPTARKLADRATEPARRVVEKVTRRGR